MEDSVCCIDSIHTYQNLGSNPSLDGEAIKDSGSAHCVCGYQFGHLSRRL